MKKPVNSNGLTQTDFQLVNSRRKFLKTGSLLIAGSSVLFYACDPDSAEDAEILNVADAKGFENKKVYNLGKGDIGILNYAYVLEQLEAEFYTQVLDGAYWASASMIEKKMLEDIYKHEVIHREFFQTVLSSFDIQPSKRIPELEFDFSSVDFSDRDSVLGTSIVLEDTGVSAYNGAGDLIENTDYLLIAGKIVSVEARHASAVRSVYLMDDFAFAGDDVVDPVTGLDLAAEPKDVIPK